MTEPANVESDTTGGPMLGRTIGHYEIVEKLGQGGMGVVYKARDTRLDRFVALKILSSARETLGVEAARFEQEANAISALNHPHIATIHDRGEVDGQPFLVLEYLAGGTLRDKLGAKAKAGKPLPIEEILRYALQSCEALAHAHRRGVIHRDIKTENLMLSEEDQIKVTDFGLAQWMGGSQITGDGESVGTASYMSPEQAEAEKVDERSDVFSFGLVLYEMAVGTPPFEGLYQASIIYDIVNTPTPSIRGARPDLPEDLDRVIRKATAKDPRDRFADFPALREALRTIQVNLGLSSGPATGTSVAWGQRRRSTRHGVAAAAAIAALLLVAAWFWPQRAGRDAVNSSPVDGPLALAVLPLENLSGDPAHDYVAVGITEALIAHLAKLKNVRVTSRTSVLRYRKTEKSLRAIGGELGVNRIVEGSALVVGNRIRITAQLINAQTDEHLWAESYQFEMGDVLDLQRRVSAEIALAVQKELDAQATIPNERVRKIDPAAYEAYIRGRMHAFQWNAPSIRQGIEEFKRAVEIQPDYGAAYAGLAIAYGFLSLDGSAPPDEVWPRAREAAEKALEIDSSLYDAHAALGFVQAVYDWNWSGAERALRRSLELNPNNVDAYHALAMTVLAPRGRLEEAKDAIDRAVELDPLSPAVTQSSGEIRYFNREFEAAAERYQRAIELDPTFEAAYVSWAAMELTRGAPEKAKQIVNRMRGKIAPQNPLGELCLLLATGNRDQTYALLSQLAAGRDQMYVPAGLLANVYALLGDREQLYRWLDTGFQERSSFLISAKVHPAFDPYRDEERFRSLLRRMNLGD